MYALLESWYSNCTARRAAMEEGSPWIRKDEGIGTNEKFQRYSILVFVLYCTVLVQVTYLLLLLRFRNFRWVGLGIASGWLIMLWYLSSLRVQYVLCDWLARKLWPVCAYIYRRRGDWWVTTYFCTFVHARRYRTVPSTVQLWWWLDKSFTLLFWLIFRTL